MESIILTSVILAHLITPPPEVPRDPMPDILHKLAVCESSLQNNAINVMDGDASSFGRYQFKIKTFVWAGRKYGLEHSDIWSVKQQEAITRALIQDGYWKYWYHCGKIIGLNKL